VDFGRASLQNVDGVATVKPGHMSDILVISLMGFALVVGLVGIAAAALIYRRGPSKAVANLTSDGFGQIVHRIVQNKFYVDELYELAILKPFRWTAHILFEVVDRFLIDLIIVNGAAYTVDTFGRIARWFQNGQVQRYMVGVVIGGALIFYYASSPDVDFDAKQGQGNNVEFIPKIGDGLDAKGALVEFDLDLDGETDFSGTYNPRTPMVVPYTFGGPGDYKVTMRVTDAVFNETYSITKTIKVKGPDDSEDGAAASKGGAR
jgi:hypothetical protein